MRLNKFGIYEPPAPKRGCLTATVPRGHHFLVNDGGVVRPVKDQTGWRVRCQSVGSHGAYLISFDGGQHKTLAKSIASDFDFIVTGRTLVAIEHEGMVSADWSAIVVSRIF